MSELTKIGFYGNLIGSGTNHGYGYTAVELIEAWQRKKMPVWWGDNEAPVAFSFVQPHGYEYELDRVNIGYTPWESTQVPEAWPFYMNKMTEVWTTSYACKQWYEDSGRIEVPIRVLHHGLNRKHWPVSRRVHEAGTPFRFLHVGEPAERKGGEMAYNAFREAFGEDPSVVLYLKGKPRFEVDAPNVFVIEENLTQEDLLRLYQKAHAFIYPTNGEGFGLLPFQGMATGMPTIATAWGGCLDFIEYGWELPVKDLVVPSYEPHEGLWAEPDKQALIDWMQDIVVNPEWFFEEAYQASLNMDRYWSWDYLAEISLNWMRELLNKK